MGISIYKMKIYYITLILNNLRFQEIYKLKSLKNAIMIKTILDQKKLNYNIKHIVSGSSDKSIKVWDLDNGKCTQKINGNTYSVNCLLNLNIQNKNIIVSGSSDESIKVWNLDNGKCTQTLNNASYVLCLLNLNIQNKNIIVSG